MRFGEFLEAIKPIILNPKDARKIVKQNPDLVAEPSLIVLRDLVEVTEESGFPRARLLRMTLTLLEQIATEIRPLPTEETKRSVEESIDKFGEAFEEMKRRGD